MNIQQLVNAPKGALPVDPKMVDGLVASTDPIEKIFHEETGFAGNDFVPAVKIKRVKRELDEPDEHVYVEPGDEDFIDAKETERRSSVRSKLTAKYVEEIMKDRQKDVDRYNRSREFVDKIHEKYGDSPVLEDGDLKDKYLRAVKILNAGPPVDEAQIRRNALHRASTTDVADHK